MSQKSVLKKLASETAIYGVSTILARFINFLFFPLYTYYLTTVEYGVFTEFMAYIAVFQVVLVMGLETGCFRYANKEGERSDIVFSNALISVSVVSLVLLLLLVLFGGPLSTAMGYQEYYICYVYIGIILATDSFTAILFAKLRFEYRAWKFASFKTVKILTETLSNVGLFFFLPKYALANPDAFIFDLVSPTPDFSYPIFSIFLSCIVVSLLFIPDILKLKIVLDKKSWLGLMNYSLPLMIAGLPGVINDFLDRILFRFFNVDDAQWRSDLGVYQAGVKVAVIMSLFVQMFRFAAEPFFFARARENKSRELYAKVMEYFVEFCMLIFLGVILYIDIIEYAIGPDFRVGMDIIPIMLLSFVMLGMIYNVSMWYKLSDNSRYAIYITVTGLVVTAVINVLFLSKYSYWAAAWGHFFSYLVMLIVSVSMGNKYYKIPYKWARILTTIAIALAIYGVSIFIPESMPLGIKLGIHTLLILIYIFIIYLREKTKSNKICK